MSEDPEQWTFLAIGWRVAYSLTGSREGANKVFKETMDEVLRHPGSSDLHSCKILFFSALRRRALRFPASCELTGLAADLHRQPEPGRSALVLFLLDALHPEDIERVLQIDERQLVEALDKTRSQLWGRAELPL